MQNGRYDEPLIPYPVTLDDSQHTNHSFRIVFRRQWSTNVSPTLLVSLFVCISCILTILLQIVFRLVTSRVAHTAFILVHIAFQLSSRDLRANQIRYPFSIPCSVSHLHELSRRLLSEEVLVWSFFNSHFAILMRMGTIGFFPSSARRHAFARIGQQW